MSANAKKKPGKVCILPYGRREFPDDVDELCALLESCWSCPSNTARREGGYIQERFIDDFAPLGRGGKLVRKDLCGAHPYVVVVGSGDESLAVLNGIHEGTEVPELAVLLVESEEEVQAVENRIKQMRVWPARGFVVLMLGKLDYWPKGEAPASHTEEFLRVEAAGTPASRVLNGLPNRISDKNSHRGCIILNTPTGPEALTFLVMVVPESMKGTSLYTKLQVDEGVKAGKVILLKDEDHLRAELQKLVKHLNGWMDDEVKTALKERDDFLRQHGFPNSPKWGVYVDGERDMEDPLTKELYDKLKDKPAGGEMSRKPTFENFYDHATNLDVFTHLAGLEKEPKAWKPTKYTDTVPDCLPYDEFDFEDASPDCLPFDESDFEDDDDEDDDDADAAQEEDAKGLSALWECFRGQI